jgi:CRP/FNR family transcriptional regulator, cyclic AMP receptor protein
MRCKQGIGRFHFEQGQFALAAAICGRRAMNIMNATETTIAEHPFFQTMQPEHLALLWENAQETEFKAEDILFREGEPANQFFLIQTGRIDLEWRSGGVAPVIVGPGEVLGWSWLFPPFLWHFTAEALEPARAIVLDGGHLVATCENNPKFSRALMRRVDQMLIHRLHSSPAKRKEVVMNLREDKSNVMILKKPAPACVTK